MIEGYGVWYADCRVEKSQTNATNTWINNDIQTWGYGVEGLKVSQLQSCRRLLNYHRGFPETESDQIYCTQIYKIYQIKYMTAQLSSRLPWNSLFYILSPHFCRTLNHQIKYIVLRYNKFIRSNIWLLNYHRGLPETGSFTYFQPHFCRTLNLSDDPIDF